MDADVDTAEASSESLPHGERCGIDVALGRRVEVIGDLLLPAEPSASSTAVSRDITRRLEEWQGPGILIICGRLVALGCPEGSARQALDNHPELTAALGAFAARPDSSVIVVMAPGTRDGELVGTLIHGGVRVVEAVDLHCETGSGLRTVLVRSGSMHPNAYPIDAAPEGDRPWLAGIERLDDPLESRRFVTSRLLYRRLRRYLWAPPLLLAAIALLLRIDWIVDGLGHLFRSPRQQDALQRAYNASWFSRFMVTVVIAVALLAVLAVVVAVTSRGIWRALGGEGLPPPWARERSAAGPIAHAQLEVEGDDALDLTRRAVENGAAGVIVGGAVAPELTHLDAGFFACPGATSEVVHEHRGRLGLPPTFLHHRQESTIEIETGAELHVRLILATADLPMATMGERLVTADSVIKGRTKAAEVHAELVAGWPTGASWPPAPEVAADRVRVRRIRRLAAVSLFVAGAIDLLSAVTAPLRTHLHLIAQYLPIALVQAAGAVVAIAGIGMIMLSRGILRGQRRSWLVAVLLLTASLALHLVHAADIVTLLVCAAVLVLLVVQRDLFRAVSEPATLVGAFAILAVGGLLATLGGFIGVEVAGNVHHHPLPGWPSVLVGSAERLVGVQWIKFPPTIDRFASRSLLAVGISLIVVALYLLTRPVVDRSLSSGRAAVGRRAAELRARDIVRRHGTGTLDYFALRDDKQWFFHRDSLVAYAVFGGVCLVSPDPIGPFSERAHVWDAFRRYVDRHGWGLGVMGAGEEWLPTYQASGMRFIYIGDEAVVDPRAFSLEGGKMKGLRQAVNRVARYGYTVRFLDPAHLDPRDAAAHGRIDGEEPQGRAGTRLLHDAGPAVRPARLRFVDDAGRGTRRGSRCNVPVRPLAGHRRLLTRPDAPGPGRSSQRASRLRALLHDRPPQGAGDDRPQSELCGHAVDLGGRCRRRGDSACGALGDPPAVRRPPDRNAVALQLEVRASLAAALHRLRLGGAIRAGSGANHAGRVADRGAGDRAASHDGRGQARGTGRARRGRGRNGARGWRGDHTGGRGNRSSSVMP